MFGNDKIRGFLYKEGTLMFLFDKRTIRGGGYQLLLSDNLQGDNSKWYIHEGDFVIREIVDGTYSTGYNISDVYEEESIENVTKVGNDTMYIYGYGAESGETLVSFNNELPEWTTFKTITQVFRDGKWITIGEE